MWGRISPFSTALLVTLLLSCFGPPGCGGRQEPETIPEPAPPPPPQDYRGRLLAALRQEGIAPEELRCNTDVSWADDLRQDAQAFYGDLEANIAPLMRPRIRASDREAAQEQATDLAMNWFIRVLILYGNLNNLGAVVLPSVTWSDEQGGSHPLIVFHTATTPDAEDPDSCFRSLLRVGRVRHVVNLYDGDVPLRDRIEAEARVAEELGAVYTDTSQGELGYRGWREVAANAEASEEERTLAFNTVAQLIREQILRPGGEAPRGNVYVHCAGGMHRSPTISAILRRCVAQESLDQVREAMREHAAYHGSDDRGGWEEPLFAFVRDFDCSLLEPAGEAAAEGEGGEEAAEDEGAPEDDSDEE